MHRVASSVAAVPRWGREGQSPWWLCLGLLLAGCLAAPAQAQLTVDWFTIDGGGYTFSTGSGLALGGTCGQPDAGRLAGETLSLLGGFWLGGGALSSVPVDHGDPLEVPEEFRITAGLINPFIHTTGIQLDLPAACRVQARVFDHCGRLIRELHAGPMAAGRQRLIWDGTGPGGGRVASGVYLLHVEAGPVTSKRRVVLLR